VVEVVEVCATLLNALLEGLFFGREGNRLTCYVQIQRFHRFVPAWLGE